MADSKKGHRRPEEDLGDENTQHSVRQRAASWTPLEGVAAVTGLPTIVAETKS